jgi:hypothetical protein
MMLPETRRKALWITVYAIAMGVLEAAVVIYLRKLYYPEGFSFPLRMVDTDIAIVELWREVATIVMLGVVGVLAGRTRSERFAWFIYCFGIWDLVYYGYLKYALDWPKSLLEWDILFLLPVPWYGPVIAPCIVAATMCGIALTAVRFTDQELDARMTPTERATMSVAALIVIVSFTIDWIRLEGPVLWANLTMPRDLLYGMAYVPKDYPWWIFIVGLTIGLIGWYRWGSRVAGRRRQSSTPA